MRTWYETNSVATMETKYDMIGKFEIAVDATELVKIHVGKARMTNVKKQKRKY